MSYRVSSDRNEWGSAAARGNGPVPMFACTNVSRGDKVSFFLGILVLGLVCAPLIASASEPCHATERQSIAITPDAPINTLIKWMRSGDRDIKNLTGVAGKARVYFAHDCTFCGVVDMPESLSEVNSFNDVLYAAQYCGVLRHTDELPPSDDEPEFEFTASDENLAQVKVLYIANTHFKRIGKDFLKKFTSLRALILERNSIKDDDNSEHTYRSLCIEEGFLNACAPTLEYLKIEGYFRIQSLPLPEGGFPCLRYLTIIGTYLGKDRALENESLLLDFAKFPNLRVMRHFGKSVRDLPLEFFSCTIRQLTAEHLPALLPDVPTIMICSGLDDLFVYQMSGFYEKLRETVEKGGGGVLMFDSAELCHTTRPAFVQEACSSALLSVIRSKQRVGATPSELAFRTTTVPADGDRLAVLHDKLEERILASLFPPAAGEIGSSAGVKEVFGSEVKTLIKERRRRSAEPKRVDRIVEISDTYQKATDRDWVVGATALGSLAVAKIATRGKLTGTQAACTLLATVGGMLLLKQLDKRLNKERFAAQKHIDGLNRPALCELAGKNGVFMTSEVDTYYNGSAYIYGAHLTMVVSLALIIARLCMKYFVEDHYNDTFALFGPEEFALLAARIKRETHGIIDVQSPGELISLLQVFSGDKSALDIAKLVTTPDAYSSDESDYTPESVSAAWERAGVSYTPDQVREWVYMLRTLRIVSARMCTSIGGGKYAGWCGECVLDAEHGISKSFPDAVDFLRAQYRRDSVGSLTSIGEAEGMRYRNTPFGELMTKLVESLHELIHHPRA